SRRVSALELLLRCPLPDRGRHRDEPGGDDLLLARYRGPRATSASEAAARDWVRAGSGDFEAAEQVSLPWRTQVEQALDNHCAPRVRVVLAVDPQFRGLRVSRHVTLRRGGFSGW